MTRSTRHRNDHGPRGSILVLVAGILVLLVIIAASYISRTRTESNIARAVLSQGIQEDRADVIRDQFARELAEVLFPRPIDGSNGNALNWLGTGTENPNSSRLPIEPLAIRYSIDRDADLNDIPDFWWNGASYSVRPWTNWPDNLNDLWEGNSPRRDDIPGNPGTNDNRFLSDTEPARWVIDPANPLFGYTFPALAGWDGNVGTPDLIEVFTHWQHMANPMRPNNGWMIVPDISNVESSVGSVLTNLPLGPYGTPVEQWPAHSPAGFAEGFLMPATFNPFVGKNFIPGNVTTWNEMWEDWFFDYANAIRGPGSSRWGIPGNYYRFADCFFDVDGDGTNLALEEGERPQDEFVGPGDSTENVGIWPQGTPRYNLARFLTDTDGDGWTDSFWYLAPVSMNDEIRTLVGVRVVDASSLLNVSVATQFVRGDPFVSPKHGTRGQTPADLALYERTQDEGWRGASFLGNPEHWETPFYLYGAPDQYDVSSPYGLLDVTWGIRPGEVLTNGEPHWDGVGVNVQGSVLGEIFFETDATPGTRPNTYLADPLGRIDYWRRSGSRPFDPLGLNSESLSTQLYTPFTMADELELRGFAGNNWPWVLSRFERAVQFNPSGGNPVESILRSNVAYYDVNSTNRIQYNREEASEYLDQLDVRFVNGIPYSEPLHDLRRHLTTFNTTRNETMPPWMWWDYRGTVSVGGVVRTNFLAQQRQKLDLRSNTFDTFKAPNLGVFSMKDRLPFYLLMAFSEGGSLGGSTDNTRFYYDDDQVGNQSGSNYTFDDPRAMNNGRHMASARLSAALAANILSFRDADSTYGVLQDEVIPIPWTRAFGQIASMGLSFRDRQYLGMEKQPFLVEAFIAHVYEWDGDVCNFGPHPGADGRTINTGDRVLGDNTTRQTIVVVQIGNPYDTPLDLGDGVNTPNEFILSVFGQDLLLTNGAIGPIPPGGQRTFWSIATDVDQFRDALDIRDPVTFEEISNVDVNALGAVWSTDRADYDDDSKNERAVEIRRRMLQSDNSIVDVVVDRFDIHAESADSFGGDFAYGNAVTSLDNNAPTDSTAVEPVAGAAWDVIGFPQIGADADRWIQFVRVARDWDIDLDASGAIEDDERNPRFVFSIREVDEEDSRDADSSLAPDLWFTTSNSKDTQPTRFWPLDPTTGAPWVTAGGPFVDRRVIKEKDISPSGQNLIDLDFPMQMLQKDADFERVGEVLDVFTYGHLLKFDVTNLLDDASNDGGTFKTFSEYMIDGRLCGTDKRVNRLRVQPRDFTWQGASYTHSAVMGVGPLEDADMTTGGAGVNDARYLWPNLPSGARVFDLFVCDDFGQNLDPDGDFDIDENGTANEPFDIERMEERRFRNAGRFAGVGTPGLLNVNTLPREVGQALPNLSRFVHESDINESNGTFYAHLDPNDPLYLQDNYAAGLPQLLNAMTMYSNRMGDVPAGVQGGNINSARQVPMYGGRGLRRDISNSALIPDRALNEVRGDRGFASIGEIGLLTKPGRMPDLGDEYIKRWNQSWSAEFGAMNPLRRMILNAPLVDMDVSTDINHPDPVRYPGGNDTAPDGVTGLGTGNYVDEVSGDTEEANLLLSGISNLISTRSDAFIVYFKVRSVRKDPATGIWNGLDPDQIVDDARYVMIVDRSNVNRVTDEPRILLFEKLPN